MNAMAPGLCDATELASVDEAIEIVRNRLTPIGDTEQLSLRKSIGRILAEDAVAQISMPPYDRSAMDGYAFRSDSTPPLRCIGRALAGRPFPYPVNEGECVAIATGAALPDHCDAVAMRERCRETPQGVFAKASSGQNVRREGEDFCARDILAEAGTRLDARHIALLASGGVQTTKVRRRLRVAVFSVGDELCDKASGIFDANRAMLLALCERWGADAQDIGILPDRCDSIRTALAQASIQNDVIVGSAGTSVGEEDHVHTAIRECHGHLLVDGLAIKPGKPVTFAKIGHALHIALPGNPVAAFVTFLALGLPLLSHLAGERRRPTRAHLVNAAFAHRKKPGMREYVRVSLHSNRNGVTEATKASKDGSAMLSVLANADGLICLDEAVTDIESGMPVPFLSFSELTAC